MRLIFGFECSLKSTESIKLEVFVLALKAIFSLPSKLLFNICFVKISSNLLCDSSFENNLLTPIFKDGELIYTSPSITEIQNKVKEQLNKLHSGIKRFHNPHEYPIGLEERLFNAKIELIMQARGEE